MKITKYEIDVLDVGAADAILIQVWHLCQQRNMEIILARLS